LRFFAIVFFSFLDWYPMDKFEVESMVLFELIF